MKTSSFFHYEGPGRISIARYAPRNTPAGFRVCSALAPGPWFNSVSKEEYERRFFGEVLGPLDPVEVWKTLHTLVEPYEPVLLCYERLQTPGEWCHRRMVASWLESSLGVSVPEIRLIYPTDANFQVPQKVS